MVIFFKFISDVEVDLSNYFLVFLELLKFLQIVDRTHLRDYKRSFPTEEGLVEHPKLELELPHVISDSEGVSQRGDPIDDLLVSVGNQSLSELVLTIHHKIQNTPYRILRKYRLFVQVHQPVRVIENVDIIFQTILQGPSFEQCSCFGPVGRRYHDLLHPFVLLQPYRFVCHNLDEEVLQTGIYTLVFVAIHVGSHQMREITSSYYPKTHEGG